MPRYASVSAASITHNAIFSRGTLAILAAALGLAAWNAASGQINDALVWCVIAAIAAGLWYFKAQLPPLHGFLIALAAAVNGAGYTMTLWHDETLFDEIVHGFTTFAGMAAIGWAMMRSGGKFERSRTALFWGMIGLGLVLGLVWEAFEYLIGIIGTPRDTIIDIVMDMIGASAAAVLSCWLIPDARRD